MLRHGREPIPTQVPSTRRRAATLFGAVLCAIGAVVLTGCLGPDQVDPTGTAPFGHLDGVVADGDGFRAIGWVADPDTRAPIPVTVMSNQRKVVGTANLRRPDVGAAAPQVGPDHGFDVRFGGLGPGRHQVCVWADNVGRGTEARALGCTFVTIGDLSPIGSFDGATGWGDKRIRLTGWALDRETTGPISVGVLLDGSPVVVDRPADQPRADVGQIYGLGPNHGFTVDVPFPPGSHQICVIANNVGWGAHTWLGCRDVVLPASPPDRRPQGSVDAVRPVGTSGVRVIGTASDPDTAGPVTVRISVDGATPRVVAAVNGMYDTTITGLAAGTHQVCVVAVDAPTAVPGVVLTGDRAWPCGTVVLGGVSVGTSGSPSADPTPVGPPAGTPLQSIDRDAGISTELRDGSVLWLFGDSSDQWSGGQLKYFINNTAAWAPAGSPAVTQDAVNGDRPFQFVTPTGSWTCPADKPNRAMWPLSAVRTANGALDRVTAFFGNVCLGSSFLSIESHGVSVVQWDYNPAAPPVGQPIVGTVVNQQLFGAESAYGTAAVTSGSWIYGYACASPPDGPGIEWPNQYGPCTVGRVPIASVGNRSAWTFWNGTSWVASAAAAAPIIAQPDPDVDAKVPVSSVTVSYDAVHGAYVMAYSPWPGFTDRIFVRVATSPQGPWTDPVQINLPGCNETIGSVGYYCYAGTTQPQLSEPGLLGLGYYDQLVAVGPNRGQYLTITVPFTVVISSP